jgi:hypothetical protein
MSRKNWKQQSNSQNRLGSPTTAPQRTNR